MLYFVLSEKKGKKESEILSRLLLSALGRVSSVNKH